MRLVPAAVALVVLLLGGAVAYRVYERYVQPYAVAREEDGQAISRVIGASLAEAADLRVSRLSGTVQAVASDRRMGGLLNSTRVMKAPFEVGYFVDLSRLDRGDFFWDARARTLIVTAPDVRIDGVHVDEARTTLDRTSGVFVTRDAMAALRRQASAEAQRVAQTEAARPERLAAARRNGRAAIATLFARPLRIAGLDVRVQVHFAGTSDVDAGQLDRSRSLAEIYAEAIAQR